MTAMAKSHQHYHDRGQYAARRAKRREEASARLTSRVVHPVAPLPQKPRKRLPGWVALSAFGGVALLIHFAAVATLLAVDAGDGDMRTSSENVTFNVVETPAPPEETPAAAAEPESVPAPEPEVAPEPTVAPVPAPEKLAEPVIRKKRKAAPKNSRPSPGAMAMADPVNQGASDPAPSSQKRAVVGITMESTVTGGSGPSYAVGNTRMGTTAAVQSEKKIEKLAKGKRSGKGGSGTDEAAEPVNRAATFIPTVSSSFTKPKRISDVDLSYPSELRQKGIEGNVMVLIVINEQGEVQKVRILKSSGYREFDEAALKAARKEMYRPAKRDGKAVEYNLKYTYRFRIKGA